MTPTPTQKAKTISLREAMRRDYNRPIGAPGRDWNKVAKVIAEKIRKP
jgi:hypothetical protein